MAQYELPVARREPFRRAWAYRCRGGWVAPGGQRTSGGAGGGGIVASVASCLRDQGWLVEEAPDGSSLTVTVRASGDQHTITRAQLLTGTIPPTFPPPLAHDTGGCVDQWEPET